MTRADSPLTRARDAILMDTTRLSARQVADKLLEIVSGRLAAVQHSTS